MAGKRKSSDGSASVVVAKPRLAQEEKAPAKRSEEEDFPRGGASTLTPAEIREAREEADAEFAKEKGKSPGKKGGKKPKRVFDAEQDDGFHGSVLSGNSQKSVSILKYKTLVVGMKIWGVVSEITKRDLVISLPGGLRGFVAKEEASDVFEKVKKEGSSGKRRKKNIEADQFEPTDENKDLPFLSDLFTVGQLVACTVRKLSEVHDDKGRGKPEKGGKAEKDGKNEKKNRRIELSLKLNYLYDGLSIDAVHEGQALTAVVTSIEDHGYLLSFGVPAISGFLLHKNYLDGNESTKLRKGQLVQGVVISVDKKRGAVGLKASPGLVATNMVKEFAGLTVDILTPGAMVNARVRAVLQDGILLSFLTYFTGTVDIFHLEDPLPGASWKEKYSENQRVKARILYMDPVAKTIGLTLNPQLINHATPVMAPDVGYVFEDAVIRRVDHTLGLLLEIPIKDTTVAGYVHISNVSETRIEKLEKKFPVGKKVRGRVIGHRVMDALSIASMKESVVEQLLISTTDVKPSMHVTGTVLKNEPFGAIIELAEGLRALCSLNHMSEFQRSNPSSKFQVGAKLKFRVLSLDEKTSRIQLTHKKSLLTSKLSPITSYDDAMEGLVTHGFISSIQSYGVFVEFYNGVRGLCHWSGLGLEEGAKVEDVYKEFQGVKCRVLRSNPSAKRIALSFVTTPSSENASVAAPFVGAVSVREAVDVKPGSIVSGTIFRVNDNAIKLTIHTEKGPVNGHLHMTHLSDNLGHIDQLKAVMKVGEKFDQLLVLGVTEKDKVLVSAKPSLLHAASSLPSNVSQLQPQTVIPGYIANIIDKGCFVRFLDNLTGFAPIPELSDEFVSDPNEHFKIGQSVRAQVREVHHDTGKFSLSLKQSVCFSTDASLIHGYFLEEEKIVQASGATNLEWTETLTIGSCTTAEVQEIKDYGVIVKIPSHDGVVGFVTHYQLAARVEVGKSVQARVLDVVKADRILDLSLRPELVQAGNPEITKKKNKKRPNPTTALELHQKVSAVVELVKDTYLVLSLPEQGNVIGFAACGDYNIRQQDFHQRYKPGQSVVATVENLGDKSSGQRVLLLLSKAGESVSRSVTPKKARKHSRNEVENGTIVEAEVVSVEKLQLIVRVNGTTEGTEGRVHITEIVDGHPENNPLSSFEVGQKVQGKVVKTIRLPKTPGDSEKITVVELSLRPSQVSGATESADLGALPSLKELSVGQFVTAYVQEVTRDSAWLMIGPHLRGRLFILDSSSDPSDLEDFQERFTVGTAVRCRVKTVEPEKRNLFFTLMGGLEFNAAPMKEGEKEDFGFQVGDIVGGRVDRVVSGDEMLSIQIGLYLYGRVHITHLSDTWKSFPMTGFREGQFVRCAVLDVSKTKSGNPLINLSLRRSLGGSDPVASVDGPGSSEGAQVDSIDDLKIGLEVQAFVKTTTTKGCFVTMAPNLDARIRIANLSSSYINEPDKLFPTGKLVKGRILSIVPVNGKVEMTLKSVADEEEKQAKKKEKAIAAANTPVGRRFEDFKDGEVVFGTVKRIEKFGLFVTLEDSQVVGMCHMSEITNRRTVDINKHYKEGDRVRARIIRVNTTKKRISLGLKESYFTELPATDVKESAGLAESKKDDMQTSNEQVADVKMDEEPIDPAETTNEQDAQVKSDDMETTNEQDADVKSDDDDDEEEDEENGVNAEGAQGDDESGEEKEIDFDDSEEEDEDEDENGTIKPVVAAASAVPALEVNLNEELLKFFDDDAEEVKAEDVKKLKKRAKRRLRQEKEFKITRAELKRLRGEEPPETTEEFEALVRTSPNSSLVWIKYMAYFVQLADLDKARAIAERALQTINYREEAEKANVWIAYLNLENVYGNPPKEAVLKLFTRALTYNDPKKLYLSLLQIFENPKQNGGPQYDMIDPLLKTMTRKFKSSAKVWLRQISSFLSRGMGTQAHKALDSAIQSLPRRKHIKVISRAALLEFKIGSVERARGIFEGVLRNYPRRTDLWSVYLDQEIRVGDVPVVRALFERAICLDLQPRKMKFLFKKYLDYEKTHGDAERVEHVKRKAMNYVDTRLS